MDKLDLVGPWLTMLRAWMDSFHNLPKLLNVSSITSKENAHSKLPCQLLATHHHIKPPFENGAGILMEHKPWGTGGLTHLLSQAQHCHWWNGGTIKRPMREFKRMICISNIDMVHVHPEWCSMLWRWWGPWAFFVMLILVIEFNQRLPSNAV